jgi:hypothetical protein
MRQPAIVLAVIFCLGVLWPASTDLSAQKTCDGEQAEVDAALAALDKAKQDEASLKDKATIERELIAAANRAIEEARPAEERAKNAWQGSVNRYNACLSRPGNDGCSAEKAAVDAATDKLNAAVAQRKKFENTIDQANEALAKIQDQMKAAAETSTAAQDRLNKARKKLDMCRCKKWKGGWRCIVAPTYEECCLDKGKTQ